MKQGKEKKFAEQMKECLGDVFNYSLEEYLKSEPFHKCCFYTEDDMGSENEKMLVKVYEYVVYYESDCGTVRKILVGPKTVLAYTEDEVKMKAAREIPADYNDRLDEVDILVRPFV